MSIVDELVEVLETGVGEWVRPGPEVAQAVLDHLAAKAGDVRGMLPQPRDIGREALRTDNIDGETMAEWYTRAGNAVLDLCVECLAPFVGAMRVQREPDEPIADPAERAKAVARILRGRGLHALPVHWDILLPCVAGDSCGGWRGRSVRDAELSTIAPRAIADEIQREEARRAQAWAGDTEGA